MASIRSPGRGTAERYAGAVSSVAEPLDRLGPRVEAEVERRPVDRHEQRRCVPAGSVRAGCLRVRSQWACTASSGGHVDQRPQLAVGADRQHGEIERAVRGAEVGEACSRCRRRRTRGVADRRRPTTTRVWCCGAARVPSAGPPCRSGSGHRAGGTRPSPVRRSAPGTPHRRRWLPRPSGTTNGASWVCSSARTVGRSRWS